MYRRRIRETHNPKGCIKCHTADGLGLANGQALHPQCYIRPVMSGLGANIYIILPFDDQGKMNDRDHDDKPHENEENEQLPADEATLSRFLLESKDLNYKSPMESPKYYTSLFSRMKDLLAATIGDTKMAREFHGIHRAVSGRMLKFDIYKDDFHVFEDLAYRALLITVMATNKTIFYYVSPKCSRKV